MLKRRDHLRDELLGVQVNDVHVHVALDHPVADGVHEVGLAEPRPTIDEQRIVLGIAGIRRDLHRSGSSHLVGLAFDKVLEREFRSQSRCGKVVDAGACRRRSDRRTVHPVAAACRRRPAPDLYGHIRRGGLASPDDLPDYVQEVSAHPVPDELIRRQQAQDGAVLDRVQRANPGVELFRCEIDFETIEAVFPGRWHHCGTPVRGGCGESEVGQWSVYLLSGPAKRPPGHRRLPCTN